VSTQQRGPATKAPRTDNQSQENPTPVAALMRSELARIFSRVDLDELTRRDAAREALNDALACTWRRRAEWFEWARPRLSDFNGNATAAELAERDRKLAAQALACRNKAALLELGILDDFEGEL
jgi:hypothetical protein